MELVGLKEALDNIGKLKKEFKSTSDNPLHQLMLDISNRIVKTMQEQLKKPNSILSQSITHSPIVIDETGNISINIQANEYWDFVNQGVNGWQQNQGSEYTFKDTFPSYKMQESIQDWEGRNGIGDADDFKSISIGIAIIVKKFGIKPTHFVDVVLSDSFINEIAREVSEQSGKFVSLKINN